VFAVIASWTHLVAASTSSSASTSTWWEYILLFLAVAASWAGVPAVGSAAVAAAAVGASQGNLDLTAVIVVSAVAGEVGGLLGYSIGTRWGAQLLARPGKRQAGRRKLMDKGELAYAKWGRLAVFFTPAIISGTAKMKRGQFLVWNFIASVGFTVSVAATAYGVGRVTTGHHSRTDILILVGGLATSSLLIYQFVRRHRQHKTFVAAGGPVAGSPTA
jgi:membrane protein DedA with SNARE-associated domain